MLFGLNKKQESLISEQVFVYPRKNSAVFKPDWMTKLGERQAVLANEKYCWKANYKLIKNVLAGF